MLYNSALSIKNVTDPHSDFKYHTYIVLLLAFELTKTVGPNDGPLQLHRDFGITSKCKWSLISESEYTFNLQIVSANKTTISVLRKYYTKLKNTFNVTIYIFNVIKLTIIPKILLDRSLLKMPII